MSPAPHVLRAAPRRACLRVLVLLLALLLPGAHADAHALPVVSAAGETGGTAAEHDVLDTAPRPPLRDGRRAVVTLRPAPLPAPAAAPGATRAPAVPAPPRPPYIRLSLRSVVLRC